MISVFKVHNGVIVEHTINGVAQSDIGNKYERKTATLPSIGTMARNVLAAAVSAAKNPKRVSDEEKARRLAICEGCEFLIRKSGADDRCAKCGCYVSLKTALEAWHCPIGKW